MNSINLNKVSACLCYLFFCLILAFPDGYKIVPSLLAIAGLLSLPLTFSQFNKPGIKWLSISFTAYFLVVAFVLAINGGHISELDMPSRALIAICILLLVVKYPPKLTLIFYSTSIGAIIAATIAIYVFTTLDNRAFTYKQGYMVIQAGGMCMTLAICSLVGGFYGIRKNIKHLQILCLIGLVAGVLASLLSGARGSWVLSPLIIVGLFFIQRQVITRKIAIGLCIALIVSGTFSYPILKSRVDTMLNDITQYDQGNSRTSSGARLEMWKSALYSALEHPLIGQGFDDNIKAAKLRQIEAGLVKPIVLKYGRAHNQYLEDLQTKGLLGLITLMFFFCCPLYFFYKILKQDKAQNEAYFASLTGITFILSIMGYGLTQHYLNHNSGIIFYCVGTVILYGCALSTQDIEN